jgi:succinate dehydrogenase assembly factor 1
MKPPGTRPKFRLLIAYTFRKNAHAVTSRDFSAIEYMLRQGVKQVEMYENPAIRDCILSEEIKKWGEKRERDGEGEPRW